MFYLYHVNAFAYHELKDQFLIGRTTGQLVFGDDGMMSGKHAQISVIGDAVTIEDLGSKNLTIVNRIQIPSLQKVGIKPLCLLEVGSQQFILTDNKTMTIDKLNAVLDHHLKQAIVKRDREKTALGLAAKIEDPIAAKEKLYFVLEKELADLEATIKNANTKKAELLKTMTTIKAEVNKAKALKADMENKKKKIINLKDIGD